MRAKLLNFLRHELQECLAFLSMTTETYPNTLKFQYEKLDMILARLEEAFPDEPVKPSDLPPDIYYRAGQVSVLTFIKKLLEEDVC